MANAIDSADAPEKDDKAVFDWQVIQDFLVELRSRPRLLLIVLIVLVGMALLLYLRLVPVYTAVAVIGPPGPAPTDSLLAGGGGMGGVGSTVARRLIGGGGASGANDPYQEYLQLLQSVRLARTLANKEHMLQKLYPGAWDDETKSWKPPGASSQIFAGVRRFFHRPIPGPPNVDTLAQYLDSNLVIAKVGPTSGVSALINGGPSPFSTVSFRYTDPRTAEAVLETILQDTDDLIRQDQKRDVEARIAYLNAELPRVTQSDQRDALIATLSGQDQLRMMIAADQRFASTLIDPPHASDSPTWPPSPTFYLAAASAFSVAIWIGLVFLSTQFQQIRTALNKIERPTRSPRAPVERSAGELGS